MRLASLLICLFVLSACSGGYARFDGPVQCAPYAREYSRVKIHGPARTWWHQARGRYTLTHRPRVGDVIVFRATRRLPQGHVAVVERVVTRRKILVAHANWEPGKINRKAMVKDVSRGNTWTLVRVYWAPTRSLGHRPYAVKGFIEPKR